MQMLDAPILAAMVAGSMRFGMLALAATMAGAWWLGSPFGFKLALIAAALSYVTQTLSALVEVFGHDAISAYAHSVIMVLWLVTIIIGAAAIAVVCFA